MNEVNFSDIMKDKIIIPKNMLSGNESIPELIRLLIDEDVTTEGIIYSASKFFNIEEDIIKSKTRVRVVVDARHITMWLIHNTRDITLKGLGVFFGSRDHSTIVHALDKVKSFIEPNGCYEKDVKKLIISILKDYNYDYITHI